MGKAEPVLGYPSKTAACAALAAKGMSAKQIGAKVGIPSGNVSALLRGRHLNRTAAASHDWTPEKKAKAIRLYAKIIEQVAADLDVPPRELLTLWTKGTKPAARRTEITAKAAPAEVPASKPLIAKPALSPAPSDQERIPLGRVPASMPKYHLRAADGLYLHFSGEKLTRERAYAWAGTRHQARNIKWQKPQARGLRLEAAPEWKPRDAELAQELREK